MDLIVKIKGYKMKKILILAVVFGGMLYAYESSSGNEYKYDLRNGKGTLATKTYTYIGDWLDGNKHGYGTLKYKSGEEYKGEFDNDLFHGKGEYENSKGDIYIGDFVHDKRSGKGEYKTATGIIYKGEFDNDLFEGYGEYADEVGNTYKGQWKASNMHGTGTYISKDGDTYTYISKEGSTIRRTDKLFNKENIDYSKEILSIHQLFVDNLNKNTFF